LSHGGAPDLTHLSHAEQDALTLAQFRQLSTAEAHIAALAILQRLLADLKHHSALTPVPAEEAHQELNAEI